MQMRGMRMKAPALTSRAWAKHPRALAGRLRRAQTFLRTLGIEITFSREGRTGTRMIHVSTSAESTVSTVSTVSAARSHGSRGANRTFCFGRLPSAGRSSPPPDLERLDASRLKCVCSASIVRSFDSSPRSNLATVSVDTLADAASSRTPKPRADIRE
jgi:hypothetical protein